jgi:sterol desaturase/sphingolipid hydroxylase (fatty acid hydroxylase superfamily)
MMAFLEPAIQALQADPVNYAPVFFISTILLELMLSAYWQRDVYKAKDALSSIAMGVGVLFIGAPMKILAFFVFSWLHPWAPESFRQFLTFDNPWMWVLLFFADDFTFYWHHRLSHQIRLLWSAHENHHSAPTYNLAVALRQSWTEILYKYIFWLWLPLVGFPPVAILMMMSFSLIYQFWVHTELIRSLGPLEWVLNTPSHHRVHHASNIRYLDRNHAGTLIIWDRLFGTFQAEDPAEPVVYGIRRPLASHNPFVIAFHEYGHLWKDLKKARSWSERLGYLFRPPGWSPDGSSLTADQLRALEHSGKQ